jgi:hypothetical protein
MSRDAFCAVLLGPKNTVDDGLLQLETLFCTTKE